MKLKDLAGAADTKMQTCAEVIVSRRNSKGNAMCSYERDEHAASPDMQRDSISLIPRIGSLRRSKWIPPMQVQSLDPGTVKVPVLKVLENPSLGSRPQISHPM